MDIQQWLEEAEISLQPVSVARRPRDVDETEFCSLLVQHNRRNVRHSSPINPLRLNREVSSRGSCNISPSGSSCSSASVTSRPAKLSSQPSEAYRRRPRHKTRVEKYRSSQKRRRVATSSPARIPSHKEAEVRPKRSKNKSKKVSKPSAGLVQTFKARNVSKKRITLDSSKKGFYTQGRASAPTKSQGLGDLVFSELGFLRKRDHDKQSQSCELTTKLVTPEPVQPDKPRGRKHARSRDQTLPTDDTMTTYFERGHINDPKICLEAGTRDGAAQGTGSTSASGRSSVKGSLEPLERPFLGHGSRGGDRSTTDGRTRLYTPEHRLPLKNSPRVPTKVISVENLDVGCENQAVRADMFFQQIVAHATGSDKECESHERDPGMGNEVEESQTMDRPSPEVPALSRTDVRYGPVIVSTPNVTVGEPARSHRERPSQNDEVISANQDTSHVARRDSSASASSLSKALKSASWSLSKLLDGCHAPEPTHGVQNPLPLPSPMAQQHQYMADRGVMFDAIMPDSYLRRQLDMVDGSQYRYPLMGNFNDHEEAFGAYLPDGHGPFGHPKVLSEAVWACSPDRHEIGGEQEAAEHTLDDYESSAGQSFASSQWSQDPEGECEELDDDVTPQVVGDPGQHEPEFEPAGFWHPNLLY